MEHEQWKLVKSDVPLVWGHVYFDPPFFLCWCAMAELLLILLSLSGSKFDVVSVAFHHFFHITSSFYRTLLLWSIFLCFRSVFSFQPMMIVDIFLDLWVIFWSFVSVSCWQQRCLTLDCLIGTFVISLDLAIIIRKLAFS